MKNSNIYTIASLLLFTLTLFSSRFLIAVQIPRGNANTLVRDLPNHLPCRHLFVNRANQPTPLLRQLSSLLRQRRTANLFFPTLPLPNPSPFKLSMQRVCPGFLKIKKQDPHSQKLEAFWVWYFGSIAKIESSCGNDLIRLQDRNGTSVGLFQIPEREISGSNVRSPSWRHAPGDPALCGGPVPYIPVHQWNRQKQQMASQAHPVRAGRRISYKKCGPFRMCPPAQNLKCAFHILTKVMCGAHSYHHTTSRNKVGFGKQCMRVYSVDSPFELTDWEKKQLERHEQSRGYSRKYRRGNNQFALKKVHFWNELIKVNGKIVNLIKSNPHCR